MSISPARWGSRPRPAYAACAGKADLKGFTALLNDKALGFDVTAFAMIRLHSQAEADLIAFEERARSSAIVRDCYMLSGEIDFLLKCVAPDLSAFQDFIIHELTAAPNVASVKTSLAHPCLEARGRCAHGACRGWKPSAKSG
jgi:DNA-binding Lrp family transcriptional regulator